MERSNQLDARQLLPNFNHGTAELTAKIVFEIFLLLFIWKLQRDIKLYKTKFDLLC